jgi:hypothetical protein
LDGLVFNVSPSETNSLSKNWMDGNKLAMETTKKLSHKLKYETGIEPALNEVEIKKYVSEVISEIRK